MSIIMIEIGDTNSVARRGDAKLGGYGVMLQFHLSNRPFNGDLRNNQ